MNEATTVLARAGTRIDAAAAGLGAGNTPMEVLVAVCDLMGIETGVDVAKITDVAEDRVVPIMDFPIRIDRDALTLGYAGVYGSFLLFAKRAAAKYGVPAREILIELGRRGMVGGRPLRVNEVDLRTVGVVMEKNGDVVSLGAGAAVLGHPAAAIAMLANHLGTRGEEIPAGCLILSGGITEAVAVKAGDNVTLRVHGMGSVSMKFV